MTEPCSTGIGGDCFCLYFERATGVVHALNGSGRSPAGMTLERVVADVGSDATTIPLSHIHCVTVPGAAAGWADAVERWGSMPLSAVLQPAIDLARRGFPVTPVTAYAWGLGEACLRQGPNARVCSSGARVRVMCLPCGIAVHLAPFMIDARVPSVSSFSTTTLQELLMPDGKPPRAGDVFRNENLARTFELLAEKGTSGFYSGAVVEPMPPCDWGSLVS